MSSGVHDSGRQGQLHTGQLRIHAAHIGRLLLQTHVQRAARPVVPLHFLAPVTVVVVIIDRHPTSRHVGERECEPNRAVFSPLQLHNHVYVGGLGTALVRAHGRPVHHDTVTLADR